MFLRKMGTGFISRQNYTEKRLTLSSFRQRCLWVMICKTQQYHKVHVKYHASWALIRRALYTYKTTYKRSGVQKHAKKCNVVQPGAVASYVVRVRRARLAA